MIQININNLSLDNISVHNLVTISIVNYNMHTEYSK